MLTCCATTFMKVLSRLEGQRAISESDNFYDTFIEILNLDKTSDGEDTPDCDIERTLTREKPECKLKIASSL
jgi:hypothetical protein